MSDFVPEMFPEQAAYLRVGCPGWRDTVHPPHTPLGSSQ